jgi:hypothetical protein
MVETVFYMAWFKNPLPYLAVVVWPNVGKVAKIIRA